MACFGLGVGLIGIYGFFTEPLSQEFGEPPSEGMLALFRDKYPRLLEDPDAPASADWERDVESEVSAPGC